MHTYRAAARNTFYLKKLGVTHVLNSAEGSVVGAVDTNQGWLPNGYSQIYRL